MRPRWRAIFLVAAVFLVVGGLLLAGPAHLGLHGADDGHGCEACTFHGASPAVATVGLGPPRLARLERELAPPVRPAAAPRLLPPARGPPRIA